MSQPLILSEPRKKAIKQKTKVGNNSSYFFSNYPDVKCIQAPSSFSTFWLCKSKYQRTYSLTPINYLKFIKLLKGGAHDTLTFYPTYGVMSPAKWCLINLLNVAVTREKPFPKLLLLIKTLEHYWKKEMADPSRCL